VYIWDPKGLQQQVLDCLFLRIQAYDIAKSITMDKPDKKYIILTYPIVGMVRSGY
jgi:hypothetical protein